MFIKCVGVIDSGVGGLTVLKRLKRNFPQIDFIYYGDSLNVPYGNKSDRELFALSYRLSCDVLAAGAQCVVLACSTLSLTVLSKLRQVLPVPVFGVFPPVESALISGGRVLLMATERTCEKFSASFGLTKLPLLFLASIIERNIFSLNKLCVNDIFELPLTLPSFDTVILGCTHYELILPVLKRKFPFSKFVNGADNTVEYIKTRLRFIDNCSGERCGKVVFLGQSAEKIRRFWEKVVFKT